MPGLRQQLIIKILEAGFDQATNRGMPQLSKSAYKSPYDVGIIIVIQIASKEAGVHGMGSTEQNVCDDAEPPVLSLAVIDSGPETVDQLAAGCLEVVSCLRLHQNRPHAISAGVLGKFNQVVRGVLDTPGNALQLELKRLWPDRSDIGVEIDRLKEFTFISPLIPNLLAIMHQNVPVTVRGLESLPRTPRFRSVG